MSRATVSDDHPVSGHVAGDAPAPVGAIRALDGFHVLAGDQGQQRHRFSGPRTQFLLREVSEQPMGVSIAWLVRGNRKLRYRGTATNDRWLHHRAAALNLRRLITMGLTHTPTGWAIT